MSLPEPIWLSLRKAFTHPREFSDKPQWGSFDRSTTFDVAPTMEAPKLVLFHGFNCDFDAVNESYSVFWAMLCILKASFQFKSVIYALWPGGERGPISWPFAIGRAEESGERMPNDLCDEQSIWITHSLGARYALSYLKKHPTAKLGKLIMLAPAVDDEAIAIGGEFEQVASQVGQIVVFYSTNDPVLGEAYRFSFAKGHSLLDKALGNRGKDPREKYATNIYTVDCSTVVRSHGGYRDAPSVIRTLDVVFNNQLIGDVTL